LSAGAIWEQRAANPMIVKGQARMMYLLNKAMRASLRKVLQLELFPLPPGPSRKSWTRKRASSVKEAATAAPTPSATGTPATLAPNFRLPINAQSPAGNPGAIGEQSMAGCYSQPVMHQGVLRWSRKPTSERGKHQASGSHERLPDYKTKETLIQRAFP